MTENQPLLQVGAEIIKRAIQLEQTKQFTEALICYQEGIQVLMKAGYTLQSDQTDMKQNLRTKIESYITRAEAVKDAIANIRKTSDYHEQWQIPEGSTGFGYQRIFSRCLENGDVTKIVVEDPYVRSVHQIQNFVKFVAICLKSRNPINEIHLITSNDPSPKIPGQQKRSLNELSSELAAKKVTFRLEFKGTLHDREIRFDNGWVIKIGRGLDIYKRPPSSTSLSFVDDEFRICLETTVDIYRPRMRE